MPDYNIPLSTVQGAASQIDTRLPLNSEGTEMPFKSKQFQNVDPIEQAAKAYRLADNIGQFQENQAVRMDEQLIRETKARDQAILKAYQQSGNGLHSSDDLTLAVAKLQDKLSPDTLENLQKRRDSAKDYETHVADTLDKASADHLDFMDRQYEFGLRQMSSLQQTYNDAISKGSSQPQALQAYESAKQAQLQQMAGMTLPGSNIRLYSDQVLKQYAAMNPDQLKTAIENSKYNRELLQNQLKNKLTQSQTDYYDARTGKTEVETEELPQKLALLQKKTQGGTPLSDEDKETLAEMVRKNVPSASTLLGRLPAADKEAVISMITKLNKGQGTSASDAAVSMVGEKSDAKSLDAQTKKLDAVNAIMSSFQNNIQTWDSIAQGKPPAIGGEQLKSLGDQLQKIDFTDSTALNNWKNSIEKQFNDPSTVAYLTSAFTVAMDYARILSSQGQSAAQVSDSARHEAQQLIASGYNDNARKALIGTLESDAQGQVKGLRDQVEAIKKRMAGAPQTGGTSSSKNDPAMKISPEEQKKRDADAVPILQQERQKEMDAMNASKTPEDKANHQKNLEAIDRELKRHGSSSAASATNYPTATNPKTGEKVVFKDGSWQPMTQ